MKKLLLFGFSLLMFTGLMAQYPVVTIQDIQTVPGATLAMCVDTSTYENDTVTTHGVVVMEGGIANSASGRQIWIQNGTGPFSGITVRFSGGNVPTTPDDILDLEAGDSVKITGVVGRFGNESQLDPLINGVELLDVGKTVQRVKISAGDLNDNTQTNILPTGEQWEGSYVTLTDVTVQALSYFSGSTRVSIIVQDAAGNTVNISDRFNDARPANGFVPPNVGAVYDSLSGVISHSANGCTGAGGRGYEMFPHTSNDYNIRQGTAAPLISGITRNPITPKGSDDVTIRATIEDPDGMVTSAELSYAVGIGTSSYNTLPMTNTAGNIWEATITNTNFSDGDFVKYYICAEDNDNLTNCAPDVPGGSFDPLFFSIRDNGLTIYDLQFTPYSNGNSGYLGMDVTVTGIVTASSEIDNLGTIFIQQENGPQSWTGIQLVPGAAGLTGLAIGDEITVNGTIQESFGNTNMQVNMLTKTGNTGVITPTSVDPDIFTSYDFMINEQYEGMLLKFENSGAGPIYVVDVNPAGPNNNFGEYRVGKDEFSPAVGSLVLAGRNTGNAPGSLNVGYVNDMQWVSGLNPGVASCIITYADTMSSMTGLMFYSFSNMKLLPRNNDDFENYDGANCPLVGIEDELAGSLVRAFPNPVSHDLNVSYRFTKSVQAEISLVDLMGRQVAATTSHGVEGQVALPTSQLAAGTYVMQVRVENVVIARQKVIVTH